MSDTAVVDAPTQDAVPDVAPQAEPASQAEPAPQAEDAPSPPPSVREVAKQFADELARNRDDQGRFTSPDSGGEETPPADGEDAPPSAVPDGFERIELPDEHPLQSQGRKYIDVPKADELAFRNLIKTPVRRSELEQAQAARKQAAEETARLRRQVAMMEAQAQLQQNGQFDQLDDPKLQRMLEQAEKHDPERGKLLREAVQARKQLALNQAAYNAEQQQAQREHAQAFLHELQTKATEHYGIWANEGQYALQSRLVPMVTAYGQAVQQRMAQGGGGLDVQEFFNQWVDPQYVQDPRVQQAIQEAKDERDAKLREQARMEGQLEAKQQQRQTQMDAVTRHQSRPPNPAAGQRGVAPSEETVTDRIRNMDPSTRRRAMLEASRRMAAKYR